MQNKAFSQLFKVACLCNNAVFDASAGNMATNIMARRVQGNVFYAYASSALYCHECIALCIVMALTSPAKLMQAAPYT